MSGNAYARIANNFAHDLASGMWAACVLVIWVLRSRTPGLPADAAAALAEAMRLLFYVSLVSLAVIFATGGVRLRYWRIQGVPDEVPVRRRALLAKHVFYFVVYGAGTFWAWRMLG